MSNFLNGESFEGFEYSVSQLSKYIRAGDIFTIMLKTGVIVNYSAPQEDLFEAWLIENDIINIRNTG